MEQLIQLNEEFLSLLEQEEAVWKQRVKKFWLQHDDRNSKYFHRQDTVWRRGNTISMLRGEDELWIRDKQKMHDHVVMYFWTYSQHYRGTVIKLCT